MEWTLATFNVNGIRARLDLLLGWLERAAPDVVCLQEIKCEDQSFPAEALARAGYSAAWWGQKSYNGVAILSRRRPAQVLKGFEDGQPLEEARLISALVDGVWVVNSYVPQGRDPDHPAFQYKLAFLERLGRFLAGRFTPADPLVWLGDINVAPEPLDVFDPQRLEGQVGFHPAERQAYARVKAWGLSDLFRRLHPEEKQFTFWDYRLPKSLQRNLGWRIDHLLATEPLAGACQQAWVDMEPRGREKPSDHTPMLARFQLPDQA
ncbi:MAG: exodeoxyribonuclease III [Pseudomonadota bacterium]